MQRARVMSSPSILIVAKEADERAEIAAVILRAEQQVFCACNASEVIDFELAGLTWAAVVFGGKASVREARAYLCASGRPQPTVVIATPPPERLDPEMLERSRPASLASLIDVIDHLPAPA